APVPVLAAVHMAVTRGRRDEGVRRAALLGLVGERVVRRELPARVERQHLREGDACALADATDLVGDAGEVRLDRRHPPRRVLLDLGPLEAGDALERLAVVPDRIADLGPRRLAVLAPDLASGTADRDRLKCVHFWSSALRPCLPTVAAYTTVRAHGRSEDYRPWWPCRAE